MNGRSGEPRQREHGLQGKKTLTKGVKGILKDQLVVLKNAKHEGMLLRRVEAQVEINLKTGMRLHV
jgi:hypothetical protein